MRYIGYITLYVAICCWPKAHAQTGDVVKIEFNSLTRGFHEQIIISPDTFKVVKKDERVDKNDKIYCRKVKSKEWSELINTLNDVMLTEINDLKSPTRNRMFDGALHSSLIITMRNGQSCGHAFDDENPHKKLELLMKTIRKLADKR